MRKLLIRIIMNMIAIWLAAYLIAGISYPSLSSLFFAALIFAVVNAIIKPILVIISFPLTLLTLGLFLLVINGITVEITAMLTGLHTATFMSSIQAGIIIAISNWFLYKVFNKA
ncbi:MAG: hypothetical protein XD91_0954 [Clostridiales bacterium 38_11]|nr:MAG: hypothetical protein XD91_0954 [Clostridiales bacterium 38_11]HBH13769.1 hypothetical protein [Clostridiales bacterium]